MIDVITKHVYAWNMTKFQSKRIIILIAILGFKNLGLGRINGIVRICK